MSSRSVPTGISSISLSDRILPADLGRLPERVYAFSWVPQMSVLSHADVMVTHGGISTIDECVISGVPMLVYCGFETDMGGTTARVVHHGIGIAGDRRRDGSRVIREHIDRLLDEPHFETNLSRLRKRYEAYGENRVAEQVVESLLRSSRRSDTRLAARTGCGLVTDTARRVAAGAGWLYGYRWIERLLDIVSVVVLARILSPDDFGLVAIAASFISIIEGMSAFDVNKALIRTRDEHRALYDTAWTLSALRGIVSAGIMVSVAPFLTDARIGNRVVSCWH